MGRDARERRSVTRGFVGHASAAACLLLWLLALPLLAHQESALVREFGGKGAETGQLSDQTAFYADASGNLYVVDATYKRIQRFDADGVATLAIDNTTLGSTILQKPTAITATADGSIYVVDLEYLPITNAPGRPVFYYAHAVRRFASDGTYQGVLNYLELGEKSPMPESALLAVTSEGELSAIVPYGDTNRKVILAPTPRGTILVNDRDTIFEVKPDGEVVGYFGARGGRDGESHDSASMSVDAQGNIYVADTKNHRIVVYGPEGDSLRTFGTHGTRDGQLTEPFLVSVQADGTILVGDHAVYVRSHATGLPLRKDDPSPVVPESMLRMEDRLSDERLTTTLIRRVQRFTPEGKYLDRQLVRFPVESYASWHYDLCAIGGDGRTYCEHSQSRRIRVYEASSGVAWSNVHRTLNVIYDMTTLLQEVDNPDLDAVLGTEADFRARGFLFRDKTLSLLVLPGTVSASAQADLRLAYDWNERERFAFAPGFYSLRARSEQFYQAEAGLDPERSFPQDDRDHTVYDQAQFELVWDRTLNQDPYRIRSMSSFANFGFGKVTTINFAVARKTADKPGSQDNLRRFTTVQTFLDWELGVQYDLGTRLYATASVLRGPAYAGYNGWWTYVDETGALFAQGFNSGRETRVQLVVEGLF